MGKEKEISPEKMHTMLKGVALSLDIVKDMVEKGEVGEKKSLNTDGSHNEQIFDAFDIDDDGKISFREFKEIAKSVSPERLKEVVNPLQGLGGAVLNPKTSKDEFDEVADQFKALIEAADTNGDKSLSVEELEKARDFYDEQADIALDR